MRLDYDIRNFAKNNCKCKRMCYSSFFLTSSRKTKIRISHLSPTKCKNVILRRSLTFDKYNNIVTCTKIHGIVEKCKRMKNEDTDQIIIGKDILRLSLKHPSSSREKRAFRRARRIDNIPRGSSRDGSRVPSCRIVSDDAHRERHWFANRRNILQ